MMPDGYDSNVLDGPWQMIIDAFYSMDRPHPSPIQQFVSFFLAPTANLMFVPIKVSDTRCSRSWNLPIKCNCTLL